MNSIVVACVRRDLRYGLCHCVWEIEELKEMTNGLAQEWEKWKKAIEQANILENLAHQKHHLAIWDWEEESKATLIILGGK